MAEATGVWELDKSQSCSSKANEDLFVRKLQEAQLESLDSVRVPAINNAPSYAGRAYAKAQSEQSEASKPTKSWANYKSRTTVDSGLEALLAVENPPTNEEKGSKGPF